MHVQHSSAHLHSQLLCIVSLQSTSACAQHPKLVQTYACTYSLQGGLDRYSFPIKRSWSRCLFTFCNIENSLIPWEMHSSIWAKVRAYPEGKLRMQSRNRNMKTGKNALKCPLPSLRLFALSTATSQLMNIHIGGGPCQRAYVMRAWNRRCSVSHN